MSVISRLSKKVRPFQFLKLKGFFQNFKFNNLFSALTHDVGIDLGTANTLVWVKGKGVLIREPSVVARHKKTKEILAIGTSAKRMLGRAPAIIETIRPLKDGVIADFDATAGMLTHYIKRVHESGGVIPMIPRPRVVIGIPSGVTEVERRAVIDAAISSGAREANLIEEPMAAALGAGLPVEKPDGTFIIDIGGGTSEMAVISLGGIVVGRSVRVAGDEMNEAIITYVRLKYSLLLGEPTAEEVKIAIGSAKEFDSGIQENHGPQSMNELNTDMSSFVKTKNAPAEFRNGRHKERFFVVRGRDLESGLPKSVKLSSTEIREALAPVIQEIVQNVANTIEETPPELLSDIMETGIVMAGGGALLHGIDEVVAEKTKMPVTIADDPLTCVVRGCGIMLEDMSLLTKIKGSRG